jgi:hypothetical protein
MRKHELANRERHALNVALWIFYIYTIHTLLPKILPKHVFHHEIHVAIDLMHYGFNIRAD